MNESCCFLMGEERLSSFSGRLQSEAGEENLDEWADAGWLKEV